MSDEGMFRPPGAPGSHLRPWQAPDSVLRRPPAGSPAPVDPDDPKPPSGDSGTHPPTPTRYRLIGVGTAVVLGLVAGIPHLPGRLPWFGFDQASCTPGPNNPIIGAQQLSCENLTLDWWQVSRSGVLLAVAAGVMLLVRLARRGPAFLDLLPSPLAGYAGVLAVRALFGQADRQLDLTWSGPLVVLPLLGLLVAAGVRACWLAHPDWWGLPDRSGARAGVLAAGRALRLPGWLRPASIRRRRRRWLIGAGALCLVLIAHGCAQQVSLGPGVTEAQVGGGAGPRPSGSSGPAGPSGAAGRPRQTGRASHPAPDGARLLTDARAAVGGARTVDVQLDAVAGADVVVDLRMTSDRRADGTVTTARNGYNVRRVGATCWVQHLPGYPPLDWVPTCTIPDALGSPTIDLAGLTDWQVMVASLPDPAGARTAPERTDDGHWGVSAADGTIVYLPGGTHADPLPIRVHSARARFGGATDVEYSDWNARVTITPP